MFNDQPFCDDYSFGELDDNYADYPETLQGMVEEDIKIDLGYTTLSQVDIEGWWAKHGVKIMDPRK